MFPCPGVGRRQDEDDEPPCPAVFKRTRRRVLDDGRDDVAGEEEKDIRERDDDAFVYE